MARRKRKKSTRRRKRPTRAHKQPLRRRLISIVSLGVFVSLGYQVATWPDVASLASEPPETTAFIELGKARHDEVDWRWVSYDAISPNLKRAVLVSEDIGFFDHKGFAFGEIRAVVRDTVTEGKPLRGASTLSQQLAKNLWLSPSRNPWRKVKEALLTVALERRLEKRRMFEIYLNVVELGPGIYGVEAGAQHYFGISASTVTEHQAARLAVSLPNPTRWHAGADSEVATARAQRVRDRMRRATWLRNVI